MVAALSSRDVAAPPLIAVVAAALMRDGLVLCTQRSTSKSQPGRWEFPGGKVEPGEGIRDALARELVEELGVSVAPGDFAPIAFAVASQRSTGAGKDIVLLLFGATRFEGEPAIKEQQLALRWLSPEQLGADEFPMPSLDEPLLPVVRATLIGTCGEAASAAPPPSPVQRVFVSRRLAAIAAALVAG